MDSKSVRRIADDLGIEAFYLPREKRWRVGDLNFNASDIKAMTAAELRERLVVGKDKPKANDIKAAQAIVGSNRPPVEQSEPPRKAKRPARRKKDDSDRRQSERRQSDGIACIKVTYPSKRKQKREAPKAHANDVWLPAVGISKWQLRQKLIARNNAAAADELAENRSQFIAKKDCKRVAKFVFDDTDKKILANPDQYSERSVKYANDARAAAEDLLAAAE